MCQEWYLVTFYEGNLLREQLLRPHWIDIRETAGKQNEKEVGTACLVLVPQLQKETPAQTPSSEPSTEPCWALVSFKTEGGGWVEALKVKKGTLAFPGLPLLTSLRPGWDPEAQVQEEGGGSGEGWVRQKLHA